MRLFFEIMGITLLVAFGIGVAYLIIALVVVFGLLGAASLVG